MRLHSPILVAIFALAFCSGDPGAAETWTCRLKESTQSGFVAETVTLVRLGDAAAVKIKDAVIEEYREGWLRGSIDVENARRITFTWRLTGVSNPPTERGSGITNLHYSLTVQKKDNVARVLIQSFPNGTFWKPTFTGQGQCSVVE